MERIPERQKVSDEGEVAGEVAAVVVVLAEAVASAGVCFSKEGGDQRMVGNQRWVSTEGSMLFAKYSAKGLRQTEKSGVSDIRKGGPWSEGVSCTRGRGQTGSCLSCVGRRSGERSGLIEVVKELNA